MNNLVDIQNQIQKLQKQASEIRDREFDKTIQDILTKMQAFGIAVKDLQSAMAGARKSRVKTKVISGVKSKTGGTKKKTAGVAVAAKFRGPNGESWSGRGLTPRWMASLIAQGKTKEDFAIQS
ncbi:MAG: H-NS histone family protein [Burkholderiales bacterium]